MLSEVKPTRNTSTQPVIQISERFCATKPLNWWYSTRETLAPVEEEIGDCVCGQEALAATPPVILEYDSLYTTISVTAQRKQFHPKQEEIEMTECLYLDDDEVWTYYIITCWVRMLRNAGVI